MKTMDDALAACQRENDNFYLTAFMIEAWLGDVTLKTVAQYAERKSAKNRKLQQGLAVESFEAAFGIPPRRSFTMFSVRCSSSRSSTMPRAARFSPRIGRCHWNILMTIGPNPSRR
jgi:hypothetical protein